MYRTVVGAQRRIDNLEAKAKSQLVQNDAELQAQLARFMCVLSSGLLEQAIISILEDYAKSRSHAHVARYVGFGLSRLQNAKFEDIMILLARFDPLWRDHFEANTPAEVKDAIDSIVNNRNQIAHGGQANISLVVFSRYYTCVKSFINELDSFVASH
jgi:RiboL-PSP-HEPN